MCVDLRFLCGAKQGAAAIYSCFCCSPPAVVVAGGCWGGEVKKAEKLPAQPPLNFSDKPTRHTHGHKRLVVGPILLHNLQFLRLANFTFSFALATVNNICESRRAARRANKTLEFAVQWATRALVVVTDGLRFAFVIQLLPKVHLPAATQFTGQEFEI